MSAALPLLQSLTESAEGLARGGYLLVADGDAFVSPPETVPLATGASARIVRVGSELALRHALWRYPGAPLIALVPEDLALPADLLLCAERRRVHTLTGDEVLSAALRTRVVGIDDDELRKLALQHAADIQARLESRTTPTVIDRSLLERTLVEVVAELEDLRGAHVDLPGLLAQWIGQPPAWSPVLRRLAAATLEAEGGDEGRVLAWALAAPETRAPALLVHGALLSVDGDVPAATWGELAPLGQAEGSPLRVPALARAVVVDLARRAVQRLDHAARPLLARADSLARQLLSGAQSRSSTLLPLAFEEGAHQLAVRLARGEPAAPGELARLQAHAVASSEDRRLQLLGDMARLARYLQQPRSPAQGGPALAASYLSDHAWADWCARRAERALSASPAHHAEAKALLERVSEARDALNLRFAQALALDYEKTLYSRDHGVVALPKLSADVLSERRMEPGCGRVFLLVLDGCSVPVFLDLLDQLSSDQRAHKVGLEAATGMALRLQPGLSPLPTITSHARGALFLGAIPLDPFQAETVWKEEGERSTDPARFKQNPALGSASRQLFLKGDLADGGQALQAALRGPTDVVAAVFNAVDDRIGSHDTGAAWRMEVEDITGLVPALHAALAAERKVLLTADHGHSPFRSKALRVGAGSTPRFLRMDAGEPLPDGFLEIDCGDLAGPAGRQAFAWRSGAYRGQVQVGFHGGASLEEVVVPVAWLHRNGPMADAPPWWTEGGAALRPVAPTWAPTPVAPASPSFSVPAPTPSPPPPHSGGLPAALAGALSPEEGQVVVLLLREGRLRTSDIAAALGKQPGRFAGFLSKLNRKLVDLGARLPSETLPDGEQQWRYEGPQETP